MEKIMKKRIEHRITDNKETKYCSGCDCWKEINNFQKCSSKWDGLSSQCRECVNDRIKKKYLKDIGGEYKTKIPHKKIDGKMYKKCQSCKEWRNVDEYSKDKYAWDELTCYCKTCQKKKAEKRLKESVKLKRTFEKKHNLVIENSRTMHKFVNKSEYKFCRRCEEWKLLTDFSANIHKWDKLNPKCRECSRKKNTSYTRERRKDPLIKLIENLRKRTRIAIMNKKGIKSKTTQELLGCDWETVRMYIAKQFRDGMTWENYGRKGWHIDHILPCASFDLTKIDEQKKCFHYTNLQPLWWWENLKKSDKIIDRKHL
jgi:hypothetical protein